MVSLAHIWFPDLTRSHSLSLSLSSSVFFPPLFFCPVCFLPLLSSLFLSLSVFLLCCPALDIGLVVHPNICIPTCVHFGCVGGLCRPLPQPLRAVHPWRTHWHLSSRPSSPYSCSRSVYTAFTSSPSRRAGRTVVARLSRCSPNGETDSVHNRRLSGCCVAWEQTCFNQKDWKFGASYRSALEQLVVSIRQQRAVSDYSFDL